MRKQKICKRKRNLCHPQDKISTIKSATIAIANAHIRQRLLLQENHSFFSKSEPGSFGLSKYLEIYYRTRTNKDSESLPTAPEISRSSFEALDASSLVKPNLAEIELLDLDTSGGSRSSSSLGAFFFEISERAKSLQVSQPGCQQLSTPAAVQVEQKSANSVPLQYYHHHHHHHHHFFLPKNDGKVSQIQDQDAKGSEAEAEKVRITAVAQNLKNNIFRASILQPPEVENDSQVTESRYQSFLKSPLYSTCSSLSQMPGQPINARSCIKCSNTDDCRSFCKENNQNGYNYPRIESSTKLQNSSSQPEESHASGPLSVKNYSGYEIIAAGTNYSDQYPRREVAPILPPIKFFFKSKNGDIEENYYQAQASWPTTVSELATAQNQETLDNSFPKDDTSYQPHYRNHHVHHNYLRQPQNTNQNSGYHDVELHRYYKNTNNNLELQGKSTENTKLDSSADDLTTPKLISMNPSDSFVDYERSCSPYNSDRERNSSCSSEYHFKQETGIRKKAAANTETNCLKDFENTQKNRFSENSKNKMNLMKFQSRNSEKKITVASEQAKIQRKLIYRKQENSNDETWKYNLQKSLPESSFLVDVNKLYCKLDYQPNKGCLKNTNGAEKIFENQKLSNGELLETKKLLKSLIHTTGKVFLQEKNCSPQLYSCLKPSPVYAKRNSYTNQVDLLYKDPSGDNGNPCAVCKNCRNFQISEINSFLNCVSFNKQDFGNETLIRDAKEQTDKLKSILVLPPLISATENDKNFFGKGDDRSENACQEIDEGSKFASPRAKKKGKESKAQVLGFFPKYLASSLHKRRYLNFISAALNKKCFDCGEAGESETRNFNYLANSLRLFRRKTDYMLPASEVFRKKYENIELKKRRLNDSSYIQQAQLHDRQIFYLQFKNQSVYFQELRQRNVYSTLQKEEHGLQQQKTVKLPSIIEVLPEFL